MNEYEFCTGKHTCEICKKTTPCTVEYGHTDKSKVGRCNGGKYWYCDDCPIEKHIKHRKAEEYARENPTLP